MSATTSQILPAPYFACSSQSLPAGCSLLRQDQAEKVQHIIRRWSVDAEKHCICAHL